MGFQEGPAKISVFGLLHRTTCSVEAYNRSAGEIIPTKSNLFAFVGKLQLHEKKKAFDANLLDLSGGASGEAQKLKAKVYRTNTFILNFIVILNIKNLCS